jgi:cephalosporin hydroxylase
VNDDRGQFAAEQLEKARSLAIDPEIRRLDVELTAAADRYDYSYYWTWLGVPIIQMPTDIVVMQELAWRHRPNVIIETGVARGGSALLSASLLSLIGDGHVVAVDVDIRPHNRESIEQHPLSSWITLIEGSSTAPEVLAQVEELTRGAARVMVVLDSDHTHEHVLAELEAYAPLVTNGMPLVVADTLIEEIPANENRPRAWRAGSNPHTAVEQFLAEHSDFTRDEAVANKLLMSSSRTGYLIRR